MSMRGAGTKLPQAQDWISNSITGRELLTSASCPAGSLTLDTNSPYYGSTNVQSEQYNKLATGSTSYSGDCSDSSYTITAGVYTLTEDGEYVDTGKILTFDSHAECQVWARDAQPDGHSDKVHDHWNAAGDVHYDNDNRIFTWTEYGPELDAGTVEALCVNKVEGVTKTINEIDYYQDKTNLYLKIINIVTNDDTCGVWTITGNGSLQWSDTFHYAYHQVSEANIDARIFVKDFSGVEDSDIAGLMIRKALSPSVTWVAGGKHEGHFSVFITGTNKVQAWFKYGGGGLAWQRQQRITTVQGVTVGDGGVWFRITKVDATFVAFYSMEPSPEEADWVEIVTADVWDIGKGGDFYVGVAVDGTDEPANAGEEAALTVKPICTEQIATTCVLIKTGTGEFDNGYLDVLVNTGTGYVIVKQGTLYTQGQTVLDTCYTGLVGVQVTNSLANAWAGSIETSIDERDSYSPMMCIDGCHGTSTTDTTEYITVDGDATGVGDAKCFNGGVGVSVLCLYD